MLTALASVLDPFALVPAIGALEGLGIPIPGSLVIAGVGMVTFDRGGWPVLLPFMLLYGLAYSLGALLQYSAGRALGPVALAWLPAAQRARLAAVLEKYGTAAVLWTRPFAIGNYVSAPAGVIRMPWRRFLTYTFLGICPSALLMLTAGRLVGRYLAALRALAGEYALLLAAAGGTLLLLCSAIAAWRRHSMLRPVSRRCGARDC